MLIEGFILNVLKVGRGKRQNGVERSLFRGNAVHLSHTLSSPCYLMIEVHNSSFLSMFDDCMQCRSVIVLIYPWLCKNIPQWKDGLG